MPRDAASRRTVSRSLSVTLPSAQATWTRGARRSAAPAAPGFPEIDHALQELGILDLQGLRQLRRDLVELRAFSRIFSISSASRRRAIFLEARAHVLE